MNAAPKSPKRPVLTAEQWRAEQLAKAAPLTDEQKRSLRRVLSPAKRRSA